MANRDSGYKQVSGGNVAVDFVRGPFPTQTDDDRATSPSFNATGGTYIYMAWAENPFKYANAR